MHTDIKDSNNASLKTHPKKGETNMLKTMDRNNVIKTGAKRLTSIILLSLASVSSAFSADISGQVLTAESQPVCALVLASGTNLFSCNQGIYSFTNLPVEPDGSVNLQVYADGFLPYIKKITKFGPQSPVVMLPSVDDGLTDMRPLDGVYTLLRFSIYNNDGTAVDTSNLSPGVTVSGTWTIAGNTSSQRIKVLNNGQEENVVAEGVFMEAGRGAALVSSSGDPGIILLNRGRKLTTMLNGNTIGLDYAEVDQWRKIAGPTAAQALSADRGNYLSSDGPAGGGIGAVLEASGLRQLMSREIAKPL